jgi:hypothetical protein
MELTGALTGVTRHAIHGPASRAASIVLADAGGAHAYGPQRGGELVGRSPLGARSMSAQIG